MAIDFLHERIIYGRKARILSGLDLCTREKVVLSVDYSITSERLIQILESLPGLPKSFITNNGPEFTSRVFMNWLSKNSISLSYIDPGKPTQNAFVESFNSRLRSESLQLSFYRNLTEFRNELTKLQKDYNEERLHSSLNYLTPLEFKAKYGN